jgi:hypothetical protein
MRTHDRPRHRFGCWIGAATLILLSCSGPGQALAQGREPVVDADARARNIERQRENQLRDNIRASHPSLTEAEINQVVEKARLGFQPWLGRPTRPVRTTDAFGGLLSYKSPEPGTVHLASQDLVVLTGMRLGDGKEFWLFSSSADLAGPGDLLFTDAGLKEGLRLKLGGRAPARVYYAGDDLNTDDLTALCDELGTEMIRWSPHPRHALPDIDRRLQEIAARPFKEDHLTIIDGLPQDADAVHAMGLLAGRAGDWLDFRQKVIESLRGHTAPRVTTKKEFFRELSEGQSDLLILVAHSTGSQLYLNGKKTSIKELEALPARAERSPRPRVAVLISCDAGRINSRNWLDWYVDSVIEGRVVQRELSPLAQILIDKGFADKVIAPNHKIDADESVTVLRRALQGTRTRDIFKDWVSWAADWFQERKQRGEHA